VKQEEVANPTYKVFDTQHLDLSESVAAHLAGKLFGATSGPSGHDKEHGHRGVGNGVVTTIILAPVTDARNSRTLSSVPFSLGGFCGSNAGQFQFNHTLPHVKFPEFDGSSVKLD
jgi:hypothetical protein